MEGKANIETTKLGQCDAELDQLTHSIDRLSVLVENLNNKLSPVLSSEATDSNNSAPEDVLVPFAALVRNHRKSVERIAGEVDSIISRLEL